VQQTVWRNGGISAAETAVRTWKLLPRRNVSEASTCRQAAGMLVRSGVQRNIGEDYFNNLIIKKL